MMASPVHLGHNSCLRIISCSLPPLPPVLNRNLIEPCCARLSPPIYDIRILGLGRDLCATRPTDRVPQRPRAVSSNLIHELSCFPLLSSRTLSSLTGWVFTAAAASSRSCSTSPKLASKSSSLRSRLVRCDSSACAVCSPLDSSPEIVS